MNLDRVTDQFIEILKSKLEHYKELEVERYSWVSEISIISTIEKSFIFRIVRNNVSGSFSIGIPDYEHINYLVKGELSEDENHDYSELINTFFAKYKPYVMRDIKDLEDSIADLKSLKL